MRMRKSGIGNGEWGIVEASTAIVTIPAQASLFAFTIPDSRFLIPGSSIHGF